MIFNTHLDRLLEVKFVQDIMHTHKLIGKKCNVGQHHSLILYRLPYVVEIQDALIENYLEIYFSDLNSGLYMDGNVALGCSLELGLQDIHVLRELDLENHPAKTIFLSENHLKIGCLLSNLEAIDKLLPLIESKGGMVSIKNGSFGEHFDFEDFARPMWHGLKEKYLYCIEYA